MESKSNVSSDASLELSQSRRVRTVPPRPIDRPLEIALPLVLPVVMMMSAIAAAIYVSMPAAIVRPAIPIGIAGRIVNLLGVARIIRIVISAAVAIA